MESGEEQEGRRRSTDHRGKRHPHGSRPHSRSSARAERPARYTARPSRALGKGSLLAVSLTAALLTLWPNASAQQADQNAGTGEGAEQTTPESALPGAGGDPSSEPPILPDTLPTDPGVAAREATDTVHDLITAFYGFLPTLGVALAILIVAWLVTRILRPSIRKLLRSWERGDAVSAIIGILVWLVALGAALSVIAGDARALVGSVGLFGLALSWALQGPIESFTGWLMNSFQGYYRVGDRIAVGEVFGDVYEIDFLTTTVWEAGGPDKPVEAEQPTGALITFPNSDVLRSNIVNFTRDFPCVWDEVTVGVARESDLGYSIRVFEDVANRVLGDVMTGPAEEYRALLEAAGLDSDVNVRPRAYLAPGESVIDVTIRYLIPVRERRRWASALIEALVEERKRPEHEDRIVGAYPRRQVQITEEAF